MNLLLPLIQEVATSGLVGSKTSLMSSNKLGFGLLALSGVLLLAALIFVILSLYGGLLAYYTQPVASLIVSAIGLGTGLLLGLMAFIVIQKKAAQQRAQMVRLMSEVSDAVGTELSDPIKDNPKTAMLIAGVAGLIAGERL